MPESDTRRRGVTRRVLAVVAATAFLFTAAACDGSGGPDIYGTAWPEHETDGDTRYVDPVFDQIDITSDIVYSNVLDKPWDPDALAPSEPGQQVDLALDLYEPRGDTATARPAIVLAHGGGFRSHDKTKTTMVDLAKHFAHLGYVAVSIDYRLDAADNCGKLGGNMTPESGCLYAARAGISDGQAAVRWLRANAAEYRIDAKRIGFTGESAGAVIAIGVGMTADVPLLLDDPATSDHLLANFAVGDAPRNTTNSAESSKINSWASISGGMPPQIIAPLGPDGPTLASMIADDPLIRHLPAPGYFFHAHNDDEVPFEWAEDTRDQLVELRRLVIFYDMGQAGHVPTDPVHKQLYADQETAWFYDTLNAYDAEQ